MCDVCEGSHATSLCSFNGGVSFEVCVCVCVCVCSDIRYHCVRNGQDQRQGVCGGVCVCLCMLLCVCVYACMCVRACMHVCACACVCACMYHTHYHFSAITGPNDGVVENYPFSQIEYRGEMLGQTALWSVQHAMAKRLVPGLKRSPVIAMVCRCG